MSPEQFEIFEKEILERAQQNLVSKANRDYGVAEDKLFNFHTAAPILGSAEMACLAYATKHYCSIAKLVQEKKYVSKELALEKVGDMISYMVIMYALMREEEVREENKDSVTFTYPRKACKLVFEDEDGSEGSNNDSD